MRKMDLTKNYIVIPTAVFCCLLWGSAFPCVKIGYTLFNIPSNSVPSQILFAGLRFSLAGIMVILSGSIMKKKFLLPKKEYIPKILKLSSLQTVIQYIFFLYWSWKYKRSKGISYRILKRIHSFDFFRSDIQTGKNQII